MSNLANEEKLARLHDLVADILTRRMESGEATAAEINAAIKFLKDNDISSVATPDSPLGNLVASIPFDIDENSLQ